MSNNQKTVLGIAASSLALILLFPPFDQYSVANSRVPIFAGFYFLPAPPQYGVINSAMWLLEAIVVLINAGIGWLLLQDKPHPPRSGQRIGYQNAVLIFAAINLVVILLFPPFESIFALTNAAIPTFEGFYFVFDRRPNHTIVTTLLYIEAIFILVNSAIAWLILKPRASVALTPEEARALAQELRSRRK